MLFSYGHVFSGTGPVSTNPPWLSATFQNLAPGQVRLTVANLSLTGSENIDELYFNLNPLFNPSNLTFAYVTGSGGFDVPAVLTGTDEFKADGDGKYDFKFLFSNAGTSANRFTAGESMVWDLGGIGTLSASDFVFLSLPAGSEGPFYAAAHVQRIGEGSLSGWLDANAVGPVVPVPEPDAKALWLLTVAVCFAFCRSQRPRPIPCVRVTRLPRRR